MSLSVALLPNNNQLKNQIVPNFRTLTSGTSPFVLPANVQSITFTTVICNNPNPLQVTTALGTFNITRANYTATFSVDADSDPFVGGTLTLNAVGTCLVYINYTTQ